MSIRERKLGRAERKERKARLKAAQNEGAEAEAELKRKEEEEEEKRRQEGDRLEYYCHYVEFNKVRRRLRLLKTAFFSQTDLALARSVLTNGSQRPASSSRAKSNGPYLPRRPHPPLARLARTAAKPPSSLPLLPRPLLLPSAAQPPRRRRLSTPETFCEKRRSRRRTSRA